MIRCSGAPQLCPDVFVEITHPHSLPAGANFTKYHLFTLTVSKAIKIICKNIFFFFARTDSASESKQTFSYYLGLVGTQNPSKIFLHCYS